MGWLDVAREVVSTHSFATVDPDTGERTRTVWVNDPDEPHETLDPEGGILLDMFSASVMVRVHDALGPEAQARMEAMTPGAAQSVAFKVLDRRNRTR